ncbi:hypothetical protein BH23PLA1_BH23PLA1_23680 [soil metagenome]
MFLPALLALALVAAEVEDAPIITSPVGTGEAGDRGEGGPATKAQINQPFDVAFDASGNLYFSDTDNHRIKRVEAGTGILSTVAGNGQKGFSGDGGPATEAQLNEPYGIVLDRAGNLYFADRLNYRVRQVDGSTGVISTIAGNGTQDYSGDGGPSEQSGLVEPNSVALDLEERHLYIADVAGHRVRVIDLQSGTINTFAGNGQGRHTGDGGPAIEASLHGARAVRVGPTGLVFILERNGNTLRVVDPTTGVISLVAGTGKKGYSGDGGPAVEATFDGPKELDIDAEGNLFIVDTENQVIRRIDAESGIITTVAGNGTRGGQGDGGSALAAELDRPHGVAVGPDGALYIGDTNNHRIRRVAPR